MTVYYDDVAVAGMLCGLSWRVNTMEKREAAAHSREPI